MSAMTMTCANVGTLKLKVVSFNSPMRGDMRSSQTKHTKHHWPIKASQQAFQMTIQFNGWDEYRVFQDFIRKHHVRAANNAQNPEVVINFPARNINNWSGMVRQLSAGDQRFNIAPQAQIELILVDSMLSAKTFTSSFGEAFSKFFYTDIPDPTTIFVPPTPVIPAPGQPNPYLGPPISGPGIQR